MVSISEHKEGFREVGRVLKPHGIRGEFLVYLETDFPEWLAKRPKLYAETSQGMVAWTIDRARYDGQKMILKVKELPDRTHVELQRSTRLFLPEEEARQVSADPDYFFNSDLVNCVVFDTRQGKELGKVIAVHEMPAQNLLEIARTGKPALLIPFVSPIVGNISGDRIDVSLPDGLEECFDETEEPALKKKQRKPRKSAKDKD